MHPLQEEGVAQLLDDCKQLLGVRRPIGLLQAEELALPVLYGLFRLRLLLPAGFAQSFSREELRFVFLHELGHVKRGDSTMNWVMTLLQIVHWFNSLVLFAFSRMRLDRELWPQNSVGSLGQAAF